MEIQELIQNTTFHKTQVVDLGGTRRFALTRSSNSSRVACSVGRRALLRSHLRISSAVQYSGSPVGSGSDGNMSLPQIAHAAAAVTIPAKPRTRFLELIARSKAVGIFPNSGLAFLGRDHVCDVGCWYLILSSVVMMFRTSQSFHRHDRKAAA